LTCRISEDLGQLRGRARLYWAVVGVEPEELFPSPSLGGRVGVAGGCGTSSTRGVCGLLRDIRVLGEKGGLSG